MNKITTTIKIDKNTIYEEISKLTSYMGDKDNNPDGYEHISTTDDNMEFFERIFDLAYSECVQMLYAYTKNEILQTTDDKEVPETYDITLSLPKYFSETTIFYVEKLINEYIINRLMSEWIMIVKPENHSYWIERYLSTKQQISTALMARTQPLKRTLRPF